MMPTEPGEQGALGVPDAAHEPTVNPSNLPAVPAVELRKKRSNPWVIAALLLLIVAMAVRIWFQTRPKPHEGPFKAYYTTDEGRTLFADLEETLPPFDHGGKPAVRARVFSCDGGKTRFVGYLEKLPDDAFITLKSEGQDPAKMDDDDIAGRFGWAAKRPGDAQWVSSIKDPAAYQRVIHVECPDGRQLIGVGPGQDE